VERLLVWAIGVLAPAAALWKRPADWGSLLLVRVPLRERDQEQHALSAKQGGLISRTSVAVAALGSLPLLWWLDDSAVLASEFSPVLGQSRLVTLLISIPVLALMVWQVQQLSQALGWLLPIRAEPDQAPTADNSAGQNSAATDQQHTSFGLQILRLNRLAWPEPAAKQTQEPPQKPTPQPPSASEPVSSAPVPTENEPLVAHAADQGQTNPTDSSNDPEEYSEPSIDESKSLEDEGVENKCLEKNDTETGDVDLDTAEEDTSEVNTNEANFEQLKDDQAVNDEAASDEASSDDPITIEETSRADDRMITMDDSSVDDSSVDATSILETDPPVEAQPDEESVGVSGAIEIKENGEERESASLNPEVTELNSVTGGNAEEHGEQTKSSGGEQGTPDESPKATPGGE
jgi:hypothetical protein